MESTDGAARDPGARRLRVAVDGTPLLGARTGVGEFTFHLLRALEARADVDPVAYLVTRHGARDLAPFLPPGVVAGTSRLPARLAHAAWRRWGRPRIEHWTGGGTDVVHATNYVAPPARAPVLVTVHDLGYLRYPELCRPEVLAFDGAVRQALQRGAVVHTVSDYVAGEVREAYGLGGDRVMRVYPAPAARADGDPARGRRISGADRYVLALGTVEPRKNLPTLLRAVDALERDEADVRLVVAGGLGWDGGDFEVTRSRMAGPERVVTLGYVDDAARADLLAGATVFAFPSLYEGFGLPPLEAMRAGVPVVASDAGSLPEVLGDAALLVEPRDVDGLATALTGVLRDARLRSRLVALGADRARRYSWERTARELTDRYRVLATRR